MNESSKIHIICSFDSCRAFLTSFLYLIIPNLCQLLSGLPLFNVLYFGLFSLFLNCFFLLTDFLTEPRTSFYPVSPSSLIVELELFWPYNKFFLTVFIHIFPFYIFFLCTTQFTVFLTLAIGFVRHRLWIGLLLLVALLHMPIFSRNRTKLPVSAHVIILSCMHHLEVWKIDLFWVQCLVSRKLVLKIGSIFCWLAGFLGECLASYNSLQCLLFFFNMLKVLEITLPCLICCFLMSSILPLLGIVAKHGDLYVFKAVQFFCYQLFQRYCLCLCSLLLFL